MLSKHQIMGELWWVFCRAIFIIFMIFKIEKVQFPEVLKHRSEELGVLEVVEIGTVGVEDGRGWGMGVGNVIMPRMPGPDRVTENTMPYWPDLSQTTPPTHRYCVCQPYLLHIT